MTAKPSAAAANFVAPFTPSAAMSQTLHHELRTAEQAESRLLAVPGSPAVVKELTGLVPAAACEIFREMLAGQNWLAAPTNGYQKEYRAGDTPGSFRASWFSTVLAEALWARIAPHLTPDRTFDANGVGDWDGTPVWRPVGVNPLMRFVRYERAGLLIPHYDSPFVEDENHRTLMSLVIYLSDVAREQGGATRFLRDPQSRLPFAERDFSDQPEAVPVPVLEKSPRAGDALVFDHRVLHDGERVRMGRKLILRTDIMFERCPMAAA